MQPALPVLWRVVLLANDLPMTEDKEVLRAIRSELRTIRDGIEVLAAVLTSGVMFGVIFSGFLWPRPTGGWAFAALIGCLLSGGSVVKSMRTYR